MARNLAWLRTRAPSKSFVHRTTAGLRCAATSDAVGAPPPAAAASRYTRTASPGCRAARRKASHKPDERWKLKVEQVMDCRAPATRCGTDEVSGPARARVPGMVHSGVTEVGVDRAPSMARR